MHQTPEQIALERIRQAADKEAVKTKPNKKWYSVRLEWLIQAAKNLNELVTPVISLAGKVLKLLNGLQ